MHGEFKVPGGKLVVVDLDVVDNTITNFRLAGDFFLAAEYPFYDITLAVNGDGDPDVIAARRIRRATF